MNLPFLKSTTIPANHFLSVDINSENVKCLAFYVDEQNTAKIVGVGTSNLEPGAVRAGNIIDFDQTLNALDIALGATLENVEGRVSDVIFGVNGELSLGLMTTARAVRNNSGQINDSEITGIEQTIMNNAFVIARNEILLTTGNSDIDIEPVTTSTVYTKVNNRLTENPLQSTGDTLEIALFTAFTPVYHVKNLQKLAKKLKLNIIAIGSEMFALVNALKNDPDYIVINIDSDFTNVAIIFGNGITATKTLHIGANHFTKEISQKMGLTMKEAQKFKNSYVYGKLSQSESQVVQNCISDTLNTWLDGIELLFGEFSGVKTFASKIYLVGEGSKLPDLFEFISREPWTKTIPFKVPPEFYKISFENLKNLADSTGNADTPDYLMTATLSAVYLLACRDMGGAS